MKSSVKSSALLRNTFHGPLAVAFTLAVHAVHAVPPQPLVHAPAPHEVQSGELIDMGQLIEGPGGFAAAGPGSSGPRHKGRSFTPGNDGTLRFAPDAILPGRSYVLRTRTTVKERADEPAVIAVHFRRNSKSEIYRSYRVVLPAGQAARELSFAAPAFTGRAEVVVASKGNDVEVEQLSLQMREPLALTEPVSSTEGSHVLPGYALVFNDEFNGNALNRGKWFTRYIYENGTVDHLKTEQQRYRDNDNHLVSGGVLSLVARKTDKPGIYDSGMIRSDWTTRYGYFEARVKVPGGKGVFPAFWLNPDAAEDGHLEWPPEIDIFEFAHNGGEEKRNMIHAGVVQQKNTPRDFRYTDPEFQTKWKYWKAPYNFDEAWHTFGAEWTPDSVTMYVDGRKMVTFGYEWKFHSGRLAGPAHILLNLAIGGEWAGKYGVDDNAFPQALQVDWVRVYKKAE